MRKRFIGAIFAASMCAAFMMGCGNSDQAETAAAETAEKTEAETTQKAAETEETAAETEVSEESQQEETSAAADGQLDLGLDLESVTVATSPGYAPFEYQEGDELVGYDVDIWNEFSKRTGIEVNWEFADFSGLLGLLSTGRADAVSAQMAPNEEREKTYCFSDPTNYYGSTVVVAADNEEIQSVEDLAGKTVGVGSGNTMQQTVEAMYPEGEVKFETYTSATLEAMLSDLMYGRIDAVLAQDIQTYMALQSNSELKVKVLDPFEYAPGCIVFAKDNTELRDAMNEFLDIIREDGTLKAISEKWVGSDITVEKE